MADSSTSTSSSTLAGKVDSDGLRDAERLDTLKRRRVEEDSKGCGAVAPLPNYSPTPANLVYKRLINILGRDSVSDLLLRAAVAHPDVSKALDEALETTSNTRRLMIRNVSFTTDNQEFFAAFAQFGTVEDFTIVRDKDTKRSKGFGFVTFKELASVREVLTSKVMLDGRELQIKFAAGDLPDMGDGPTGPLGSAQRVQGSFQEDKSRRKLFVRNLPDGTTSERIRSFFGEFGDIEDAVAVVDHASGRGKGYGFVTFVTAASAMKALQETHRILDGKTVTISYASAGQKRDSVRQAIPVMQAMPLYSYMPAVASPHTMHQGAHGTQQAGYATAMQQYAPTPMYYQQLASATGQQQDMQGSMTGGMASGMTPVGATMPQGMGPAAALQQTPLGGPGTGLPPANQGQGAPTANASLTPGGMNAVQMGAAARAYATPGFSAAAYQAQPTSYMQAFTQ